MRADDRFCSGYGQPNPETARESTPLADDALRPPPALQAEDGATPSAEDNEDAKPNEWWQTRTGRMVGAAVAVAMALFWVPILAAPFAPFSMGFITLLAGLGQVLVLVATVLILVGPIVFVFYRVVRAVVGQPAAGYGARPSSEEERSRLLEEAGEVSKQCFEYFKHFTTITTAAALVELALYNQLGANTASSRIGVVLGVGALAMTLLLCVAGLGLLSVGTALTGEFLEIGRFFRGLMVSTASFFLFGVVIFALTAVGPVIINLNHMITETLKAIAQNIE